MLILGIETSCDETAAAVVKNGSEVLSSVVASQADLHAETGGVVPEVAAREHVGAVMPVVKKALKQANISFQKVDAIAVTYGPGLASSLFAGVVTANTLSALANKKLIPVNHILGHIRANWLERKASEIKYPVLTLTASGGHNDLVLLKDKKSKPKLIGETNDDAAGEAFDKVARLLGLGYPGGPIIEKVAKFGKSPSFAKTTEGRPQPQPLLKKGGVDNILPRAWLVPKDKARNFDSVELGRRLRAGKLALNSFDFSFSGLKSEVRRRVQGKKLTKKFVADMAAGFQDSVVDVLATKLLLAAKKFKAKEIHLAGGVSANKALRARVQQYAGEAGLTFRCPAKFSYCTDNAAMIAGAAYWIFSNSKNKFVKLVNINPGLAI